MKTAHIFEELGGGGVGCAHRFHRLTPNSRSTFPTTAPTATTHQNRREEVQKHVAHGPRYQKRGAPSTALRQAGAGELILLCQHDGQDARGLGRVGRVLGASRIAVQFALGIQRVIVDFPEDLMALDGEGAEVVLAVGVVVRGEGVKGPHALDDRQHQEVGQVQDALGDVHVSAGAGGAELVVQLADTLGVWMGHVFGFRWLMRRSAPPPESGKTEGVLPNSVGAGRVWMPSVFALRCAASFPAHHPKAKDMTHPRNCVMSGQVSDKFCRRG